jgi:hypothetical protein
MRKLGGKVRAICAAQLILLFTSVLPADALPSTDRVETYVSQNDSPLVAWDGPSDLLVAQHHEDSITVSREVYGRRKDPGKALLYALLPGLVVHGAGHFYAGDKTAGWALVGGEVLGLCLIAYAAGARSDYKPLSSDLDDEAETIGYFGAGLFVGTWIYDVIGAPLAVQRENREFLGGENIGLRFDLDHTSHSVRIQIAKRF